MNTSKDIKEPQGNNANRVLETGRTFPIQWPENDENGNTSGRVSQCRIGDMTLETYAFEGTEFGGLHYSDRMVFNVHGKYFHATGFYPFTGNLCWNTYQLSEQKLLELINTLIESKAWHCFEAPTEQYEKFERGETFLKADIEACF